VSAVFGVLAPVGCLGAAGVDLVAGETALRAPPDEARAARSVGSRLDALPDGIPDLIVHLELLLLVSMGLARVGKAPVHTLSGAVEYRARLIGLIAHGDHLVELLVEVAIDDFALLARDINPKLRHGSDRKRANGSGLCTSG